MSNISGVRATENINQDRRKYDVSDKLWYLDADIAVLAFFARKLSKKGVIDPEFRWFEKSSPARYTAVNLVTGYTSGATEIAVDDGTIFKAGMVIQDVSTGEQMRVTVVTTNTLTVSRGWGTTSATTVSDNEVIVILGNANAEGASLPVAVTSQVTKVVNYTQIFREVIDVTGTEESTEVYAGPSDISELRREHLALHMKDIERAFLFGQPKEDTSTVGTNGPIRATGGAKYFISTNKTDAGGTLTEAEFETWIRSAFSKGGEKRMGLLSPLVASAVNSWAQGKLVMYPKDKTYGIAITQYLSIHGILDFVIERMFAENTTWNGYSFAFDMANVGYRFLNGNGKSRDTKLLKDRQTAGSDKLSEEYLTEAGLFFADEARHAFLYGVTSYS